MMRYAIALSLFLQLPSALHAEDLPLPEKASKEVETLAPDGLSLFPEPEARPILSEVYVLRLAGELERIKRRASYGKWLYSEGVLAKSEQEENEVAVLRAERGLEHARLDAARKTFEGQRKRAANHEIGKAALDASLTQLALAFAAARNASDKCTRAELELATLNLRRQQKLYTTGAASRGDLRRAEAKLANVREGKPDTK